MSTRTLVWLVGLAVVALGVFTGPGPEEGGVRLLIALLACCAVGLIAELAAWLVPRPRKDRQRSRHPVAPADGKIELVRPEGVSSIPNAHDARIGRFTGLSEQGPAALPATTVQVPALLGRVAILSLFQGRFGKEWSDGEVAAAYRSLDRAAAWIEREAARWSAGVSLKLVDTYFAVTDDVNEEVEVAFEPEGDHEVPQEAHAGTRALAAFTRAAVRLGFADAEALICALACRVKADAWVWLLHPRCAGNSIAIPADITPWPGVTLAVCYAREANFPEPLTKGPAPDSVTFAHELLHLFGASDKYAEPLDRYPTRSVTDRDIMCLNDRSLSRMRIDPLTAAEIGWNTAAGLGPGA